MQYERWVTTRSIEIESAYKQIDDDSLVKQIINYKLQGKS